MFAEVSARWIDDLVGDSMRRFLCGLSWDGAKEMRETSGGDCPSHLMERWSGRGARVIRLCLRPRAHIHTESSCRLSVLQVV